MTHARLKERKAFVTYALAGREDFLRTGKAYALEDVINYLAARAAGKPATRPSPKHWLR